MSEDQKDEQQRSQAASRDSFLWISQNMSRLSFSWKLPEKVYSETTQLQHFALALGRICGLVATILIIVWADSSDISASYLGGLNWDEYVFNFHPVFMTLGAVFFGGWSITAFRTKTFTFALAKYIHAGSHFLAIVSFSIGLAAVRQSKNVAPYDPHLYSIHSWIGIITLILLFSNDIAGFYFFLYGNVKAKHRMVYKPIHMFLGKFSFFISILAVNTGIQNLNNFLDCTYVVTSPETDPALHYTSLPAGCRVSSGAGILSIFACLLILYGLENRALEERIKTLYSRDDIIL